MSTRLNPRDPLTLRIPRTLAETRRDPWAYCEGPQERQWLLGARPWRPRYDPTRLGHRVAAWACALGLLIILPLIAVGLV